MKFILDFGLLDTICDAHDQMAPQTTGKLSGEESRNLYEKIKGADKIEKLMMILKFFN